MDTRPVGFFDSGIGGISVLNAAVGLMPSEDYIYFSDHKNMPYGTKGADSITGYTRDGLTRLLNLDCKALVIACNTASGTCVERMRQEFDMPIVCIVPAIRPACTAPGNGFVLMLATPATTQLGHYRSLLSTMPDPSRVINVACHGLADAIERGETSADALHSLLCSILSPYDGMTVDGIVLGCTHYPFAKDAIFEYAKLHFCGDHVIYDGSGGTAKQLHRILEAGDLLNPSGGSVGFITSGEYSVCRPMFDRFFNPRVPDEFDNL